MSRCSKARFVGAHQEEDGDSDSDSDGYGSGYGCVDAGNLNDVVRLAPAG